MKKNHKLLIAVFIGLTFILSACVSGPRVTGTPGVALSDEMIFVSYGSFVYGMDVTTSSVEWHFPEDANNQIVFYAQPLVVNNAVYVGDLANNFHKLNIDSGAAEWTFSGAGGYYIGQPSEYDGVIYAPNNDGSLYAIDANGDLKWEFETGHYIWARPQIADDAIYVGSMDHFVYAVSTDGEELWAKEMGGAVVSSPLLSEDDGVLFASSVGGEMLALDAENGDTLWAFEADESIWGSAILVDGSLYFADSDGSIYALNSENGEALWRSEYDGSVVGGLVAFNGGFALTTEEGFVQAFNFDGTPIWQANPGGEVVQAPAVNDEYLVVGTINSENLVYVYNLTGVQLWSSTPED